MEAGKEVDQSRIELHSDYVDTFEKLEISIDKMVYILSFGNPTQSVRNMFTSKLKGTMGKRPTRSDLLVLKMCLSFKRNGSDLNKLSFSQENDIFFSK